VFRVLIRAPISWGLFLLFCFCLLCSQSVYAKPALTDASIEKLAGHSQWFRLLHYDIASGQGTFLTENFYLSPRGRNDPSAELKATLDALNTTVTEKSHPRCRFPARYAWLAEQLQQPQWKAIPPACQKLQQWLNENPLSSVSLLMVSGYMGNPASVFGHAILKLNTVNEGHDLFATTLNYGALVPPKESTILYIYRGLSGGYQSGYSDRYFYTQDVVYTNTEARDIWEYELNFEPEQIRFLQLHVWEITGNKKQYFFLTRNCAYELARVIDVILDTPLSQPARAWYVPAELFNRLHDLDQRSLANRGISLIKNIHYHPSAERKLIHEYESLNAGLSQRAKQFLSRPEPDQINLALTELTLLEQQQLLDFLFSYQHFLFIKESPEPSQETLALKHALLVKRLSLPPSPLSDNRPTYRPSPSQQQQPAIIGIGAIREQGGDTKPLLKLTAFTQEPTGQNPLNGGELTVLDLHLSLESDQPVVQSLDYVRIFQHALSPLPMASPWSWRLQLRTEREINKSYDHQIYFGFGRSKKLDRALLYGLLTPSVHSQSPILRLRPEGGFLLPLQDTLRLHLGVGVENTQSDWQTTATGTLQYSPSRAFSLLIEYRREAESSWQLMLRSHW